MNRKLILRIVVVILATVASYALADSVNPIFVIAGFFAIELILESMNGSYFNK